MKSLTMSGTAEKSATDRCSPGMGRGAKKAASYLAAR